MVEVSKLYYFGGLSQNEIAKRMFISRSQVSRILTEARSKNIVSITINDPFSEEYTIGNMIKNKYNLSDVLIVDTHNKEPLIEISEQISRVVSSKIYKGAIIGISAGKTLAMCSRHTTIHNGKNLKFIPLLSGVTSQGVDWNANNNCNRFAEATNSSHMVLSTPLIIREKNTRLELKNNPAIKPVFDKYEELDIIITGIGETSIDSTLGQCDISYEEILEANRNGAKAIIAGSFVDSNGNEILERQSEMFMGAKIKHIKKCPIVIAIAHGLEKIEAINSILKGGIIDIFCTSLETARELIKR